MEYACQLLLVSGNPCECDATKIYLHSCHTYMEQVSCGKPSLTVFVAIAKKRKKNLTMLLRRSCMF